MKRKIGLTALLCALALLVLCGCEYMQQELEANWGVAMPEGYTVRYEKQDADSFHGDGTRYHVYTWEDASDLAGWCAWSDGAQSTLYADSCASAAEALLDELEVPAAERTDFSRCLCWYTAQQDSSELLVFYMEGGNTLYVVEAFR